MHPLVQLGRRGVPGVYLVALSLLVAAVSAWILVPRATHRRNSAGSAERLSGAAGVQTSAGIDANGEEVYPGEAPLPPVAQKWMSLGRDCERDGRLRDAAEDYRRAASLAPAAAAPQRGLAAVFERAGYLDREIDALSLALKLDPSDWASELKIADIYMRLGWFQRADPLLSQAIDLAPKAPDVYLRTATAMFLRGNIRRMRELLGRGLKVAPRDSRLHAGLAEALRQTHKLPAAERELLTAISLTKDAPVLSHDYSDLAHLYLEPDWPAPRSLDATRAARTALRLDSSNWQAEYWLAQALRIQGDDAGAAGAFRVVASHDTSFETVAYQLGMIDVRSADPRTRAQGRKLLQLYAVLRERQRRFDDDLATLSAHPSQPGPHAVMVTWYLSQQRYPEAIVELRRILQMVPGDQVARKLLARVLKATGRLTEAKAVTSGHFVP